MQQETAITAAGESMCSVHYISTSQQGVFCVDHGLPMRSVVWRFLVAVFACRMSSLAFSNVFDSRSVSGHGATMNQPRMARMPRDMFRAFHWHSQSQPDRDSAVTVFCNCNTQHRIQHKTMTNMHRSHVQRCKCHMHRSVHCLTLLVGGRNGIQSVKRSASAVSFGDLWPQSNHQRNRVVKQKPKLVPPPVTICMRNTYTHSVWIKGNWSKVLCGPPCRQTAGITRWTSSFL